MIYSKISLGMLHFATSAERVGGADVGVDESEKPPIADRL